MFTKLISFVCVLTLALASSTYAYLEPNPDCFVGNELVIGNWENNYDHWADLWGNVMVAFSGTGATLDGLAGSGQDPPDPRALRVLANPGTWTGGVFLKLQGSTNEDLDIFGSPYPGIVEWWVNNCEYNMLEIDVTRDPTEWVVSDVDPYSQLELIFNWGGIDAGGNSMSGWDMVGTANSDWDGTIDTQHVVYDMAAVKQGFVDAYNAGYTNDIWCELVLLPWNGAYTGLASNGGMVVYYLDNARLTGVPEPATIALLGLGALSLIRRKR